MEREVSDFVRGEIRLHSEHASRVGGAVRLTVGHVVRACAIALNDMHQRALEQGESFRGYVREEIARQAREINAQPAGAYDFYIPSHIRHYTSDELLRMVSIVPHYTLLD